MTYDQRAELMQKLSEMPPLALAAALLAKIDVANNDDYNAIKEEVNEIVQRYE